LRYRRGGQEDVRLNVLLEATPTNFDGQRWWFTCPMVVEGIPCEGRVGKIYLPPGAKYFGCRKCHNLTYRSCQESHRSERMLGAVDRLQGYLDALKKRDGNK